MGRPTLGNRDESSNCAKANSRSNNRFFVYHTRFDRCSKGVRGFFVPSDMRNSTFNISEEVAIFFRSLELLFVAVFRFFGQDGQGIMIESFQILYFGVQAVSSL